MDEMKLGQRTHRSAPVTMILMDMVRKGEKIKNRLVQVIAAVKIVPQG
jgi:hypothetical protein